MKLNAVFLLTIVAAAALLAPVLAVWGQDAPPASSGLSLLLAKIRVDLKAGKRTETALADDLKQFDELLAAENGKRTEMAANIILAKGMLYSEVFDDPERARTYILEIKRNYSNTKIAGKLNPLLAMLAEQTETKRALALAAAGAPFPDFNVTDVAGNPLSVSQYKGKVVLVWFWSTWSQPSLAELPHIQATYAKYHDQGFEIIGVSLDEDRDKLLKYTKDNHMAWPEYFDGLRWSNKLAASYGIQSLPASLLIDTHGNVVATNVRGEDLSLTVTKTLAK